MYKNERKLFSIFYYQDNLYISTEYFIALIFGDTFVSSRLGEISFQLIAVVRTVEA